MQDIYYPEQNIKQNVKPNIDTWCPCAFIIDETVVEAGIYSKYFLYLVNNSFVEEISQNEITEESKLRFYSNEFEDEFVVVSKKIAAILLSNSKFVEINIQDSWVVNGTKYENERFIQ